MDDESRIGVPFQIDVPSNPLRQKGDLPVRGSIFNSQNSGPSLPLLHIILALVTDGVVRGIPALPV